MVLGGGQDFIHLTRHKALFVLPYMQTVNNALQLFKYFVRAGSADTFHHLQNKAIQRYKYVCDVVFNIKRLFVIFRPLVTSGFVSSRSVCYWAWFPSLVKNIPQTQLFLV